jgi:hypothetical protein
MAGHNRSKNGVGFIHHPYQDVDARDKRGHDERASPFRAEWSRQ